MITNLARRQLLFGGSAAILAPRLVQAESGKATVMRVAYPAGGPADVAARKLVAGLGTALGGPAIVENLPGAGGAIGATSVLRAPADGQVLLVTTGNDLILAPLALASAHYKPDAFRLVSVIMPSDFVLAANDAVQIKSVEDLVAAAAQREFTFGTWGPGSAPSLVSSDFRFASGVRVLDVPYKGAAPVTQALLSREIDFAFVPLSPATVDLIRTGRIKAIGVANSQRNSQLPNVRTLSESGGKLGNFRHSVWAAIFCSGEVPEAVAKQVNEKVNTVLRGAEYQRFLVDSGALPVNPGSLSEHADFYRAQIQKLQTIAARSGITPQ
jgi:tripartite-type tricarboxylate transporter receptor subunit TctC